MNPSSIPPSPNPTQATPPLAGVDATAVRAAQIPAEEMAALLQGQHGNPFAVLGLHQTPLSDWVFRTVIPAQTGAVKAQLLNLQGQLLVDLERVDAAGFFIGVLPKRSQGAAPVIDRLQPLIIEATTGDGHTWRYVDAYTFGPVLGPMDDHLMAAGDHLMLSNKLGANVMMHEGVSGVHFAVWAPNARRVSVVGHFNDWDGRRHIMRKRSSGVWEVFVPDLPVGSVYKYEIMAANGDVLPLKADPMAQAAQLRPDNASVVANTHGWDDSVWQDAAYLRARSQRDARAQPMSIYEVHLGSWQRADDGGFLSYDELAARLIPYVKDMGYTHIEVLPITEHPLDASWGYQPTGLFAPTARFGAPDGFARLVDAAHAANIGVILDWVPAHFPTDAHGLAQFDGTALYEHADKRQGYHPDWNTAIFNFGRTEVCAYLLNNALHWLDKYHLDGLRVDAVASMLYLDYSRKDGEWIPNAHGGRENLEAIAFLQRVNSTVYAQHPGVMTIAEESTAFPGVSHPVYSGGLGFGFKWNMGFMHDTLDYFKLDPVHRQHHHNRLTFGLLYAFTENFVLPLSHDEVVHGKGTLLTKMSGDHWQQFANLRALYGFMWGYPGKKLLFMGQEFAQRAEWNENKALDWHLLDYAPHRGVQQLVRDLNHAYQTIPSLHQADCDGSGFAWAVVDDHTQSVLAWTRHAEGAPPVLVVANLTPVVRTDYRVPVPSAGVWREVVNTDAAVYGGSNVGNMGQLQTRAGDSPALHLTLPPLSTLILVQEAS